LSPRSNDSSEDSNHSGNDLHHQEDICRKVRKRLLNFIIFALYQASKCKSVLFDFQNSAGFIPTRSVSLLAGDRKPAYNPMQFVKVGPANLYQQAKQQMKQVEEVKQARAHDSNTREWKTEEEDWQSVCSKLKSLLVNYNILFAFVQNLNNWKCTRRKKVEPLIERVVEVKKYGESFDPDNSNRRRKTFSEMMQERYK
jgi:hypothetical protein